MSHRLISGTAAGTLLSTLVQLHSSDLLKTALLAAIGALVSFAVSWLLQYLLRKRR